jgi:outer membrane protein W
MKGIPIVLATGLTALFAGPAHAQTAGVLPAPVVPRPDIAGTIGWLSVNKSELTDSNDWYNRSAQGALIFGWYWSPHIKTELEASASSHAELYAAREDFINGIRVFGPSEYHFSTRRVTFAAQYQFGDNAWFHPHVAAGVDVNREKTRRFDHDVYVYDPVARLSTLVHRSTRHPDAIDTHVRPFVGAGFKGYFTRRGFVRSDVRVILAERIEEAIVRVGVGVDF